jgi:hypothetical protein
MDGWRWVQTVVSKMGLHAFMYSTSYDFIFLVFYRDRMQRFVFTGTHFTD